MGAACIAAIILLAAACTSTSETAVPDEARSQDQGALAPLPATFTGVLPCADCPGIEYHLDVFPDSAFYLKRTYLERPGAVIDEIGSWAADADTATLAIWGDDDMPTQLRIVDSDTLRLLDREGEDIASSLNYSLTRAPSFDPATLERPLRGMYRYMADAGFFSECESGRRFAVAQEGDNAALERAYLEARRQPGDALLVSLDGRLTMRPPMEGSGSRPTLIVSRFTGVWPAETCGARMSRSALLDTNWVVTRLGDEAVTLAEGQRQPRLVLQSEANRVTGFGGCNEFNAEFEITGRSIAFGTLAATLRACPERGDHEARLFAALENATSYGLFRHHLELYDGEQNLLARFEARALD